MSPARIRLQHHNSISTKITWTRQEGTAMPVSIMIPRSHHSWWFRKLFLMRLSIGAALQACRLMHEEWQLWVLQPRPTWNREIKERFPNSTITFRCTRNSLTPLGRQR
jgi:hypothetical protein